MTQLEASFLSSHFPFARKAPYFITFHFHFQFFNLSRSPSLPLSPFVPSCSSSLSSIYFSLFLFFSLSLLFHLPHVHCLIHSFPPSPHHISSSCAIPFFISFLFSSFVCSLCHPLSISSFSPFSLFPPPLLPSLTSYCHLHHSILTAATLTSIKLPLLLSPISILLTRIYFHLFTSHLSSLVAHISYLLSQALLRSFSCLRL